MDKIYKGEIQRLFPILEAIKEGKTIQWNDMGVWCDIDGDEEGFVLDTLIGKPDGYRIKPESTYRPFKDAEECWAEMQKHQPFGWVKIGDWYCTIKEIRPTCVFCHGGGDVFHYEDMVKQISFIDGTPFGVKVEG